MSKNTVNVGVVGLGFMGATHVAAIQSAAAAGLGCRLSAVCDNNADRLAGRLGGAGNLDSGAETATFDPKAVSAYSDASELFADESIDIVSICTRTDTHIPLAEAALRAGKHVLLEKPVAITAEPVKQLAAVAAECGRYCMPAMCMRFWPGWTWLKEAYETRPYGDLRSIRFTRLGTKPGWSSFYSDPQISGGALVDLHVHDTDFVVHLLGQPASVFTGGSLDHVTTLYQYPGIQHVVAEGGWDQHEGFGFTMRYVANFERATADFDNARDPALLLCRDGTAEAIDVAATSGYDAEVRHMVASLLEDRCPTVDLNDAWLAHRVIDAERRSLETGRATDV